MSSWYSGEEFLLMYEEPLLGFGFSEPWEPFDPWEPCDFPGPADETTSTQPSLRSGTRKIPDAEWQKYKEEMRAIFLTENKSREQVMEVMEKKYGFQATKAQYIRKFDQWGFKKNTTNEKWNIIARKIQKRGLDGKESDTYINGKLVSQKKIKREISRHILPSRQIMSMTAPSPPSLGGIEIRTPPQEQHFFVEYLHIPWFEFQTLVEPQIKQLRALAYGHHIAPSLGFEQPTKTSSSLMTCAPPSQLAIATDQWPHQSTMPRGQMGGISQDLGIDQGAQRSNPSIQVSVQAQNSDPTFHWKEDRKARSLLASMLGKSINPDSHDYLSVVTSHLDDILIERQDGDITRSLQIFFSSSTFEIALQLLRYSIYLSSNNLLSNSQTDDLLHWIVRSGQFVAIEHLIKMKTSTIEIFASNILLSAIRIQDTAIVRGLIALGVNVNIPGGDYPKETALMTAITKTWGMIDFDLVRLLLDAGADINAESGYSNTSPLQKAISKKNVEIVQILLSAVIIVDVSTDEKEFLGTALLLKAARDGDSELIERLLDVKPGLDPLTQSSMITLLQDAARWHDVDTIQLLLDAGADFDAPAGVSYEAARKTTVESNNFRHLRSAIQIAAARGKTEMVQVLLQAGANVDGYFFTEEEYSVYESIIGTDAEEHNEELWCDDEDNDSLEFNYEGERNDRDDDSDDDNDEHLYPAYWTPLQSAVARKDAVLVRVLLQAGADIEGHGLGSTPLQLAALNSDRRLVELMLINGADVNAPACRVNGRTALQAAVEKGNDNLFEILMEAKSELNAHGSPIIGRTGQQAAVHTRSFELVSRLISLGADINAPASPNRGLTCLQAAAQKGNAEMVQFLLNSGAEVNAAAVLQSGLTALQAAARGDHFSVVKILLAAEADVNAPSSKGGYSAVYAAVKRDNLEMLKLFLKTASPDGQTDRVPPLLKAARKGSGEIVQCLLQAGANINASRIDKPIFGNASTAIEAALETGHENIFYILWDAGAGVNGETPTLSLGASLGAVLEYPYMLNMDIVHKLLKAGADVNTAFGTYIPPLCKVAFCGDLDIVHLLLHAGADVDGRTPGGDTPLQQAAFDGNADTIQVLLNAGADINAAAATYKGRTALQKAAERSNTSLVRFLLEHGADCNAPAADSAGLTALQAAAARGNLPIALMLLKAGANINAPAAKVDGRTALEAAAEHGRLDIVSLLLKNDTDTNGLEGRCERAAKLAEKNRHIHISRILRGYKKG